jgi:DNA-binding SARP family transcriptional activator
MSKTSLSIYLLGPFNVVRGGSEMPVALRRKTRDLLAYLAATNQAASRQTLVDLFCHDTADPQRALRSILSRIRRRLGPEVILSEGGGIQVNPQIGWVDCLAFAAIVEGDLDGRSLETLTGAIDLYRGDFLADSTQGSSPEFELWLLNERARYRRLYERGLAALVARLIIQGDLEAAVRRTQALIGSNPLLEEAHARLIWLYGRTNQREAALAQYEQCRAILQSELAVEPGPELRVLRDEIVAGKLSLSPAISAAMPLDAGVQPAGDFVGRAAEMTRLQQAWAAVQPGHSLVVVLAAEAGLGKTSLVREFARTLPDVRFLTGNCYESARTLTFAPWLELLEAQAAQLQPAGLAQLSSLATDYLTRLLPTLARRLNQKPPPAPPATGGELHRLFTAVSELLLELPGTPPLLIFLDDLQWADEASLQLFHFLSRRSPPGKVLFIGAFRPEEAGDSPSLQLLVSDLQRHSPVQLPLESLMPAAVTRLIAQIWPALPESEQAHAAEALCQATGGNPLFIREIVRELAPAKELPAALPVPQSLSELIQRRLARLPGSGRQVVEALAVLAAPVTPAQAQQASGRSEEETVAAIDLALRLSLLQPRFELTPVRYDFGHDLLRQAVSGQLSHIRRQLLHRRAVVTLEQAGAPAATLAYHWQMAGDVEKEGHYTALAGEQAAALYANEEAARYLQRATRLIAEPSRRAGVLHRLGEVWQLSGRYWEAEEIYGQALALAESVADRRVPAMCRVALGRLARLKGEYATAVSWLEQAQADYQALDDQPGVAETLWGLGAVHWSQLDYARALDCFQEQLQIARRLGNRSLIGKAVGSMAVAYTEQGDYERALRYYSERLQIDLAGSDRLNLAKTAGNMGIVYAALGEYDHALACYHFLLRTTLAHGDRQNSFVAVGNMIAIYTAQGKYEVAARLSRQAIALGHALNLPLYLCEYLYASADLLAHQQQYTEAMALSDEAGQMAAGIGRTDIQLPARLLSLRLRLEVGEIDRATAVNTLQSLQDAWPEDQQQAAILYEYWRLDKSVTSLRQQAAGLFANLYTRTPDIVFRRRYEDLTGQTLPPPPISPPLPEAVAGSAVNLETLLPQVDRLILTG